MRRLLLQRGLIVHAGQRTPGPRLDAMDRADLDAFLGDLRDLLLSPAQLADIIQEDATHGAA